MGKLILKGVNLSKKIGKKQVLEDVSIYIHEGDIVGFIGPNGAGKTTTIKLILGLQQITSGEVVINGYNLKEDFKKAIKNVGAIVESPDLYMYLSGYENLKLIANLYDGIDEKRIDEVVELVGLTNRIKDKVSRYSLGMRQRLGIAQAILHKPNILILDEPTNGLDPEGIKEMRDLLEKLAKQEGMGILISSHNLAELETFCNKACIIQNGKLIEETSLNKLKEDSISNYILEVNDTKLLKKLKKYEFQIKNETICSIVLDKEQVPGLVKDLVKENVEVYFIKKDARTLEDAFLRKTGGNIIG